MDKKQNPADYIVPLNMNGLQGRMLQMPAPAGKKREILLLYGHHSSLERWFGLAQVLNEFGHVIMPDLPGFGGMESLYKVGKKPSVDELADYLADFITHQYGDKRLTIVGMSFGFVVATRMLERHPDLVKNIDIFVSLVGFTHKDEFIFKKSRYLFYRYGSAFFSLPIISNIFRAICLNPWVLRTVYGKTHNAKRKFADLSPEKKVQMMDVEVWLWRNNDVRTYMYTAAQLLSVDNTKGTIALPVWHVGVTEDHFFDNGRIEQDMRKIFTDFRGLKLDMTKHAPTIIADAKEVAPFIPDELRKELNRQ